ncbi:Peptidyl-prolyl cis-trans isomerase CWC27 like protein [Eufriesea mexicana]|nr:Peptidyl-prolyl cis-trans isomerase CWC27 like protein [Eufriesea mexicana]
MFQNYGTDIDKEKRVVGMKADKFHTRLRFSQQDLIAMANAGKDDNGSQFFFTLSSTPDLQNKHTIFEFSTVSIILYNEKCYYRDFNLLSFGDEAEEDEEESVILNKKFSGKGISAHDCLTNPKLSSKQAVELLGLANKKRKEDHSSDWENDDEVEQKKK